MGEDETENTNSNKNKESGVYLDGGWGWVVMFASFLSQTAVGSVYFGYGVLLPEWMHEFQSSSAFVSFVGSTTAGAISGSGPLASYLILKWGCRRTHMLGGAAMGLACTCCFFANSMTTILVLYSVIAGIGGGLCYVSSVITVGEFFKAKRSIAVGVMASGMGFGSFIFPVVIEQLMDEFGWRGVMLIVGGINFNMIALGLVMCPVEKAPKLECNLPSCCPSKKSSLKQSPQLYDRNDNLITDIIKSVEENKQLEAHQIDHDEVQVINQSRGRRRSSFQLMRAWLKNPLTRRKSSMQMESDRLRNVVAQNYEEEYDVFVDKQTQSIHNDQEQDIEQSLSLKAPSEKAVKSPHRKQLINLLRNPTFYVLLIHNTTTFIGVLIVYGLTPLRAYADFGMTTKQGAYLVSIMGLANLLGRFVWGFVAAIKRVNIIILFISLRLAAGALTLISPFITSFEGNAAYSALVGLLFGFWSIYPVVVAEEFGDEMLTIAFGYLEAANGVGCVVGPLVGGLLYDVFLNYKFSFILGGCSLVGGVIPLAISHYKQTYKH